MATDTSPLAVFFGRILSTAESFEGTLSADMKGGVDSVEAALGRVAKQIASVDGTAKSDVMLAGTAAVTALQNTNVQAFLGAIEQEVGPNFAPAAKDFLVGIVTTIEGAATPVPEALAKITQALSLTVEAVQMIRAAAAGAVAVAGTATAVSAGS